MLKKFFIYSFNVGTFSSVFIIGITTIIFKVMITNPSLITITISKYGLVLLSLLLYVYFTNEFKKKIILKVICFAIILLTNLLSFNSIVDSSYY